MEKTHEYYMNIALNLAQRGLGNVAPNPAVGCVIVKDNRIVGRGWTAPSGRPHAEPQALDRAGELAKGATAYVTLEPCSHHGKTPPCAEALIKAGIAHVVIAMTDPNPKVCGQGIAMLKEAGIKVTENIGTKEAKEINQGFFKVIEEGRPLVTLKIALTKDGKMRTPKGQSPWISGKIAQNYSHVLRKEYDAIMVGYGTVMADNPTLTCRLNGLENQSPTRIIMAGNHTLDSQLNCLNNATKTLVYTGTMEEMLDDLPKHNITRLLVEGGEKIATYLLKHTLADRLITIESTHITGHSDDLDLLNIIKSSQYTQTHQHMLGKDKLTAYHRL